MERPALEVADIFRDFGLAWREANRGHVSHAQLKVMSAIEVCRTAALGGYVARCENPQGAHTVIAFCRNRHCPKCQGTRLSGACRSSLKPVPRAHAGDVDRPACRRRLDFFGDYEHLTDRAAFKAYSAPLWNSDWFVYAKRPFAGPEQVLAYLSRYTHSSPSPTAA